MNSLDVATAQVCAVEINTDDSSLRVIFKKKNLTHFQLSARRTSTVNPPRELTLSHHHLRHKPEFLRGAQ